MQATATIAMPPKVIHKIPAKVQSTAALSSRPLRTVAYARVSTEKDEQELSFENQRDFYTDKIMKNPDMTFCGIYSDRGITGTSAAKRPGFQKMMRDANAGKFDLILTKSVMHFARNTMGLSGNDGSEDPYALQARISEIDLAIGELIELSAKESEQDYDSQFEKLYTEKNDIKERLAKIKTDDRHDSANQSRLAEIFTVIDGIKNHPLDWDEKFIRQMIECIKVMSRDKIKIYFRLG